MIADLYGNGVPLLIAAALDGLVHAHENGDGKQNHQNDDKGCGVQAGGGSFLLGSELLFGQLSCTLLLAELFLAGCAHVIKSSQLSSCVFAGNR